VNGQPTILCSIPKLAVCGLISFAENEHTLEDVFMMEQGVGGVGRTEIAPTAR
jgi:hypothetical protein